MMHLVIILPTVISWDSHYYQMNNHHLYQYDTCVTDNSDSVIGH